jgi:cytochrome c-type biogenesis protein CcmH
MIVRTAFVLLFALAVASPASASERHPTLSELEHEVMCPTCKTLLALSNAPVADRMRAHIRRAIARGETKSEIERQLVNEFGEAVLAVPPRRGFGLLAWALPIVGLLGASLAVGIMAWRWRAAQMAPGEGAVPDYRVDRALERRLDDELARFDA